MIAMTTNSSTSENAGRREDPAIRNRLPCSETRVDAPHPQPRYLPATKSRPHNVLDNGDFVQQINGKAIDYCDQVLNLEDLQKT
jgi:hypothetical protein